MHHYDIASKKTKPIRQAPVLPVAKTNFGDRSAGKRFASKTDKDADQGCLGGDALEFVLAWDRAQSQKGRTLSKSEVYQVVVGVLGYRKQNAPKPAKRRGRAFRKFCARCECNLEGVEEVVHYKDNNYCPACEPFIDKQDTWAEQKAQREQEAWASC